MKNVLLSTLFSLVTFTSGFSQSPLVDSILLHNAYTAANDLTTLSIIIEDLLTKKDVATGALISYYDSLALNYNSRPDIGRTLYFEAKYLDNIRSEDRGMATLKALTSISNTDYKLEEIQRVEYIMKLQLLRAKHLIGSVDKEEAVNVHFELVKYIDSIIIQFPDGPFKKYHVLNYFNLSNVFLFDNDEISTKYADSSIVWAKINADPKYIFSSYNIKYYSRYYNNDPAELNAIADSCVKYALITNEVSNLGEAYMHKCNAQVELGFTENAMNYCNLSLKEYEKLNDSTYLSSTIHNMGNVFKKAGSSSRALEFYKKALSYTPTGESDQYYNSMEAVANELFELGLYEDASSYYHDFAKGYFDYYSKRLTTKFAEAEAKYQSEIKENEIVRQNLLIEKQTNTRNLLLIASGSVLILLSTLFFGFYQRVIRKRKETELALQFEHKRAEDLEHLAQVKTNFFNNVSHELRTPLTLIMAPLEDALKKKNKGDVQEEIVLAINNSKRLLNLTNEILDLSKIDASKLVINISTIDIKSFLVRVFHSFDSLARNRNIVLQENVQFMESCHINTDVEKLEKILNNLISNALKYSNNNSTIEMYIDIHKMKQNQLSVSIKDEGFGISSLELERIFDRYYQSSTSPHASGTGIGLALVKELVSLLKGSVQVVSEIGKGSCFNIEIPFTIGKTIGEDIIEVDTSVKNKKYLPLFIRGAKPRVLIVEDDTEMSKYLASLLNKEYECDLAYNGLQALEKAATSHYDLISSDIMMPEMDGFEFRQKLLDLYPGQNTPFIMLTARILEEDKLRGLHLGVDDYITKPFSSAEFKARVYNLISNKIVRESSDLSEEETVSYEDEFIRRAEQLVIERIDDLSFGVDQLSEALNYSSRQLSRILQKSTGLTSVRFILEIRLQRAFQIIKSRKYATINEVRYEVGIESASYFSSKFKERFGVNPVEVG